MKIKIKKLKHNSVVPSYAKKGDAGLDLVATEVISENINFIIYGTGLAVEIPEGFVGLLFPRSSIRKYDLSLSNSVGVIDSGFRSEIQVTFSKINHHSVRVPDYKVGDRIAQLIVLPFPEVEFEETEDLSESERGFGGFGSTGL